MAIKVKNGKNSKQTSKASHMRRFTDASVKKEVEKLAALFRKESSNRFDIGDQIAVLIDGKGLKISDLAQYFHRRRNRFGFFPPVA